MPKHQAARVGRGDAELTPALVDALTAITGVPRSWFTAADIRAVLRYEAPPRNAYTQLREMKELMEELEDLIAQRLEDAPDEIERLAKEGLGEDAEASAQTSGEAGKH